MDDLQGRLGDRFEILADFPGGATGAVWLVRARGEGVERAVKILRPELSSGAEAVAELGVTLEAVRRLNQPNILAVEDTVRYSDRIALVMPRISGEDLRALLGRRHALAPALAGHLAAGVCDALAAAHEAGIVHGDVKPSNVLLETDPRTGEPSTVLLSDFGIAALSARGGTLAQPAEYWAPEAALGQPPIPASDVYAVGILLYETISGLPPFTAAQPEEIARRHREVEPARIASLPDPLWELIAACLVKQPERRPAAAWMAKQLRALAPVLAALPAPAAEETVRIARIPAVITPRRAAPIAVVPQQGRRAIAPVAAAAVAAVPAEEPVPTHHRHAARGARDLALAVFGGVAVFGIVIALVHFASGSPAGAKTASSGAMPNLALASATASGQYTTTVESTLSASTSASVSRSASPSASAHTTAAATTPAASRAATSAAPITGQTTIAATTTSAAPTTSSAAPSKGPVTVTWQCATNSARGGYTKTACIGIGSDGLLYVRATFTSSFQNINNLSISVFGGGGYTDTTSESCDSASCSMTSGPYNPPAGVYEAVAGIDDYAHNENSPTISYPGD
ncbi:MAG TPA: serine/threonine-protein kinase [Actinospica sp.]|nr:serine/threonine-protein kinase [Actinospica sp.]